MPEDVPFNPGLSNYSNPQTLRVDVQDRSGADMLLILGGTVIFPETMHTCPPGPGVLHRFQVRFVVPQVPKFVRVKDQVRSMLVISAMASFNVDKSDHVVAVDKAVIDFSNAINEFQVTADLAISNGCYRRLVYLVVVLARSG